MNFHRLIAVCLVSPVVIVLGINILSSNIAAESDSFLSKESLVLTTVQEDIEPSQTPVSVTGGQECFYDQKFIIQPEKRITPFNKYAQKESSYIVCGLNTLYGNSDDTGAITRNGTHVAGQVYYNENNSLRIVRYLAIPNSDSFVEYFPRTAGNYLRLHKNISQNLETDVNKKTGELKHYFTDFGGQDIVDKQGNKIIKDQGVNYSANGRWMAFDSNLGLLRLDTTNGEYFIFEKPHINGSTGDPRFEFALSNDGRYIVVIKSRAGSAKIYDLGACQGDKNLDQPLMCDSLDLKKYVAEKDLGTLALGLVLPSFTDNQSLKFYKYYKLNDGIHRDLQLLSVGEPVLFNYLGLGDSFSSGEGAYNYRPATDVVTPLNKCHLSLDSYPLLLGVDLGINSYNSVACSGAKIQDIYSTNPDKYNEKHPQSKGKAEKDFNDEIFNNFLPGYRIQQSFVEKYLPRNITISVGGNDIGFSGIITKCISLPEDCFSKERERADLAKLINDQYYPLVETYGRLKSASGGGTVNVIGYPQITSEDGACAANARFSQEELRMATQLINYLNSMIERAAKRAGVVYIDVAEALAGHRLCEGAGQALAVNGLTAGDDKFFDIGPIANESYHPNKLGQKLLQTKILGQTSGLNLTNPEPDLSVADPKVEDAADFTGLNIVDFSQPVFDLIDLTAPVLFREIINPLSSAGFAPNSQTKAWFTSEPYQLGEFSADNQGKVSFNFALNDEIPVGFHTLHLSGVNVAGEEIEQLQQIYFASSEEDFDGDGVLNQDEACLVGEPAGVDADKDGTDDACDGLVGEAPAGEPRRLPGFETFPSPKPPANNPETVAGSGDTIKGVNPSTNQAPSNSSSLQPNAGQAQSTGGNLQTGGGVQTGGNSSANNLLNQGQLPAKPLSVGVASASKDSSTSPANDSAPVNASGFNPLPVVLILAVMGGVLLAAYRRQKKLVPVEPSQEISAPPIAASPTKPKKQKKKKSKKKPHHH